MLLKYDYIFIKLHSFFLLSDNTFSSILPEYFLLLYFFLFLIARFSCFNLQSHLLFLSSIFFFMDSIPFLVLSPSFTCISTFYFSTSFSLFFLFLFLLVLVLVLLVVLLVLLLLLVISTSFYFFFFFDLSFFLFLLFISFSFSQPLFTLFSY